jgi:hypothetical protein
LATYGILAGGLTNQTMAFASAVSREMPAKLFALPQGDGLEYALVVKSGMLVALQIKSGQS